MKPQVIILLDEYNELLRIKEDKQETHQEHAIRFGRFMQQMHIDRKPLHGDMQINYNEFVISELNH